MRSLLVAALLVACVSWPFRAFAAPPLSDSADSQVHDAATDARDAWADETAAPSASAEPVPSSTAPAGSVTSAHPAEVPPAPVVAPLPPPLLPPVPPPSPPPSAATTIAPLPATSISATEVPAVSVSGAPPSSAPPHTGTSAVKAEQGATVRVRDQRVFGIARPLEGMSAEERARRATHAIETALEDRESDAVTYRPDRDFLVLYVGRTPIVTLSPEDAAAAGSPSLEQHASALAAELRRAVSVERQRSAIATTVFSFSLVIFSGLLAFLLLRKANELAERAQISVEEEPGRLPSLTIAGIEMIRQGAVAGLTRIAIDLGRRVLQVGVILGWFVFALSLFESTRGYTGRIAGAMVAPLSGVLTRIGTALPLAVVSLIGLAAIAFLLRFVTLFFGSVARGETTLGWLPAELAPATSVLVRLGIVLVALLFSAPVLTGNENGALARVALAALLAIGLSATPLLACGIVGMVTLFDGRLRVGDHVDFGGQRGRVRAVTLLEVALDDEQGVELRVPHLLSLRHATRVLGPVPPASIRVVVDARVPHSRIRDVVITTAASAGMIARTELLDLDADGATFRLSIMAPVTPRVPTARTSRLRTSSNSGHSVPPPRVGTLVGVGTTSLGTKRPAPAELLDSAVEALLREGIALGRRPLLDDTRHLSNGGA